MIAWIVGLATVSGAAVFAVLHARRRLSAERERGDRLALELKRVAADAEAAVEASHDRFEDLARAAPVGFLEADGRGDVVYVSERAAALLGCERAAARGRGFLEAVRAEDRDRVRDAWDRLVRERQRFAEPFRCADGGRPRWVLAQAIPLLEPTGAISKIVGTLADVTEQRRLEDRVREGQRIESLSLLAGGVAHDFNNLLLGIIGQADLLKARLPGGSPLLPLVEQIEIASLRGSDLAKKMLSYAGKGVVSVEPVDMREVADEMRRLLHARVSRIRTEHVTERLPPVEADPVQVRQVALNLILNAWDAYVAAASSGPVVVRTELRVWPQEADPERVDVVEPRQAGTYVVLEVEDRGSGMDRETALNAFDPFFTTKATGRGLGLAVVLGVVRRHGGGLTLRTAPGRGTSMTTWWPPLASPTAPD